ncbi:hypothetical protein BaRGS_00018729 [Batillaria attramentaria]|uniref:PDZ domain-containing protein n=1 Tax=Batillaria attramentaria TaxID=370345 RepID=A0ABD0KT06_9CAEN
MTEPLVEANYSRFKDAAVQTPDFSRLHAPEVQPEFHPTTYAPTFPVPLIVLHQVVRRRNTWRLDRRTQHVHHLLYSVPEGDMPVTAVPALRLSRDGSLDRRAAGPSGGEMVLKNLAEQLLTDDELWVFKQSLQHFRVTRSVPSLCTALRPLISNTERLMLLVELAQHLPSEPLRRDFQKLCTLHFPKYHTFLRYFSPQQVTDGSKVIAQDASGQLQVVNKGFEKSVFVNQPNGSVRITTADATSVHGAESGFYSEQDDASRHGNGRNSMSSRAGTSPPESAPSTLHRTRSHSTSAVHAASHSEPQSQRSTAAKRPSLLGSGPLKILSGSFQSLSKKSANHDMHVQEGGKEGEGALRQKRILLARRNDGSLGVGIKGGKEYGTPIVVFVVEPDSQAQQQGLRVGDRIVDVNGTDFRHVTHAEAVTMMRNAWNIIMTVESPVHDGAVLTNGGTLRKSEAGRSEGGSHLTMDLDVHVDSDNGDITVKSVEKNSAASKAGMWTGDTILQIDGMNVNTLTEKQITTLTNSKRVRLRLRRTIDRTAAADDSSGTQRSRKETALSDEAFSPLDFSSPVVDDDMFTFAASTPRNPGRSRSEERHLAASPSSPPAAAASPPPDLWRAETSPDVHRQSDTQTEIFQRIYLPRYQTPGWGGQHVPVIKNPGGGGGGGGGWNTVTRGRPAVRQPPSHSHQSPRYTLVYSVRGRSKETIVHPDVSQRPPHAPSSSAAAASLPRNSKMRYIRNRSRSRESANHATLSPADRDLLQAVQSGVEKRQRALRLSLYQVPDDGDTDWKI